jgi:hypothetical protein
MEVTKGIRPTRVRSARLIRQIVRCKDRNQTQQIPRGWSAVEGKDGVRVGESGAMLCGFTQRRPGLKVGSSRLASRLPRRSAVRQPRIRAGAQRDRWREPIPVAGSASSLGRGMTWRGASTPRYVQMPSPRHVRVRAKIRIASYSRLRPGSCLGPGLQAGIAQPGGASSGGGGRIAIRPYNFPARLRPSS